MYNMLICEDEICILKMLSENINWSKCSVTVKDTAVNGQAGLNKFNMNKFDIVLADIKMPIMSGIEMAKRIRQVDKRVQIIFLTSLSEFEHAQTAINIGACGYILKPFYEDELIKAVKSAVERLESFAWECVEKEPDTRAENFVVNNVNKYITDNLRKKLSLKDIAEAFGYNPNYLGQLYRKHTGLYVNDYIIQVRMEQAKKLLAVPGNNMGEISELLGYSDLAYFIRQFKGFFGVTPKVYRDSVLK